MRDRDDLVAVELSDEERFLLTRGLVEWGGAASCTDAMAVAMGFADVLALWRESDRLLAALQSEQPMSRWDWSRTLLATEVVFASSVMGAGLDWSAVTGLDDVATVRTLREVQRKLSGVVVPIGPAVRIN